MATLGPELEAATHAFIARAEVLLPAVQTDGDGLPPAPTALEDIGDSLRALVKGMPPLAEGQRARQFAAALADWPGFQSALLHTLAVVSRIKLEGPATEVEEEARRETGVAMRIMTLQALAARLAEVRQAVSGGGAGQLKPTVFVSYCRLTNAVASLLNACLTLATVTSAAAGEAAAGVPSSSAVAAAEAEKQAAAVECYRSELAAALRSSYISEHIAATTLALLQAYSESRDLLSPEISGPRDQLLQAVSNCTHAMLRLAAEPAASATAAPGPSLCVSASVAPSLPASSPGQQHTSPLCVLRSAAALGPCASYLTLAYGMSVLSYMDGGGTRGLPEDVARALGELVRGTFRELFGEELAAAVAVGALKVTAQLRSLLPAASGADATGGSVQADQGAEWWRLMAAVAPYVGTMKMMDLFSAQGFGDCLRMHLPRMPRSADPLPPLTPPALASALAGGVLPCLERLIRRAAAAATGDAGAGQVTPEFLVLVSFEKASWTFVDSMNATWGWLAPLLAYGDPREAGALIASLGKALAGFDSASRGLNALLNDFTSNLCTVAPTWLDGAAARLERGGALTPPERQLAGLLGAAAAAWLPEASRRIWSGLSRTQAGFVDCLMPLGCVSAGLRWLPLLSCAAAPTAGDAAAAAALPGMGTPATNVAETSSGGGGGGGGRRRPAAGSVLQIEQLRALTSELKAGGQAEAADAAEALAAQLVRWERGGGARGGGRGGGRAGAAASAAPLAARYGVWIPRLQSAAALLPASPAAARQLLGGCSNPACANLEGDSDVALPLRACAGCGGAASYCSRECQTAHWRSGHREACRGGAGGAAEEAGTGSPSSPAAAAAAAEQQAGAEECYRSELAAALRSSYIAEHIAATTLALLRASDRSHGLTRSPELPGGRDRLLLEVSKCTHVMHRLEAAPNGSASTATSLPASSPSQQHTSPLAALARAAALGPCASYLTLAYGMSVLSYMDGGGTRGLPEDVGRALGEPLAAVAACAAVLAAPPGVSTAPAAAAAAATAPKAPSFAATTSAASPAAPPRRLQLGWHTALGLAMRAARMGVRAAEEAAAGRTRSRRRPPSRPLLRAGGLSGCFWGRIGRQLLRWMVCGLPHSSAPYCLSAAEAGTAAPQARRVPAALLPDLATPPRVSCWALLQPPGLRNLEVDSDAALPLRACAGCGGAASYCSRECQMAHWRSGHREACGGGAWGRRAGRGR
ncbi:hypothetical protein HYH03_019079, partial [Edaphochlamys debaryana]